MKTLTGHLIGVGFALALTGASPALAQGALTEVEGETLPQDLLHLPGDAGLGSSGVLIRRGGGFPVEPEDEATAELSERGAFLARTGRAVRVDELEEEEEPEVPRLQIQLLRLPRPTSRY